MIISKKHRFIFFAIPRTGTHSVREALREYMGPDDWEQCGRFIRKKFPVETPGISGHLTVSEIRTVIPDSVWTSYYKFTFVRNPYDRFISSAYFKHQSRLGNFNGRAALPLLIRHPKLKSDTWFRPQTDFIVNDKNEIQTDYEGKFESFQKSFDSICATLNLPAKKLEVVNSSVHKPFIEYYHEELLKLVGDFYKNDLNLLNYSFPIPLSSEEK